MCAHCSHCGPICAHHTCSCLLSHFGMYIFQYPGHIYFHEFWPSSVHILHTVSNICTPFFACLMSHFGMIFQYLVRNVSTHGVHFTSENVHTVCHGSWEVKCTYDAHCTAKCAHNAFPCVGLGLRNFISTHTHLSNANDCWGMFSMDIYLYLRAINFSWVLIFKWAYCILGWNTDRVPLPWWTRFASDSV